MAWVRYLFLVSLLCGCASLDYPRDPAYVSYDYGKGVSDSVALFCDGKKSELVARVQVTIPERTQEWAVDESAFVTKKWQEAESQLLLFYYYMANFDSFYVTRVFSSSDGSEIGWVDSLLSGMFPNRFDGITGGASAKSGFAFAFDWAYPDRFFLSTQLPYDSVRWKGPTPLGWHVSNLMPWDADPKLYQPEKYLRRYLTLVTTIKGTMTESPYKRNYLVTLDLRKLCQRKWDSFSNYRSR